MTTRRQKMSVSIQDINLTILSSGFTNEQLTSITDAIAFARGQLAKRNVFTLRAGAKVQFTSSSQGRVIVGEVKKVNRKFVIVREGMMNWRVPANMLTAA